MAKPVIYKRNDKGSALTFTEVDTSLQNLKDATISVTDGTGTVVLDLNDTLTLSAGSGISYTVNSGTKTVEIAATESQNLFNQIATDDSTIVADGTTDTLTLSGGTGITVAGVAATDTITFILDDTAVTPGSYAMANITVDQQGRITAASSTELVGGTNISLSQDSLGQIVINATVTGITNPMVSNLDVNGYEIFNGTGNDVEITDNILVGTNGVIRISELVTSNRIECSESLIIAAHQGTFGGAVTGPRINMDETIYGGSILIGTNDDPDDKIYLYDVVNINSLTGTQITNLTNPQDGDLVYNSTTNKFQGRANGSWVNLH